MMKMSTDKFINIASIKVTELEVMLTAWLEQLLKLSATNISTTGNLLKFCNLLLL